MQGIIDADTHVVESEAIWDFFDESMAHRKPVAVVHEDPATGQSRKRWVIDGVMVPKPDGKGGQALQTPPVDGEEARGRSWLTKAMLDVEARLEDVDEMGVDVQVIFPTLFIAHLTWGSGTRCRPRPRLQPLYGRQARKSARSAPLGDGDAVP